MLRINRGGFASYGLILQGRIQYTGKLKRDPQGQIDAATCGLARQTSLIEPSREGKEEGSLTE